MITTRRVDNSVPSASRARLALAITGKPLAGGGHEVERELAEKALHPQQGCDVGFIVDTAGHVEELMEALVGELIVRISCPAAQGGVDLGDATVGSKREVAAGRVLEQILEAIRSGPSAV